MFTWDASQEGFGEAESGLSWASDMLWSVRFERAVGSVEGPEVNTEVLPVQDSRAGRLGSLRKGRRRETRPGGRASALRVPSLFVSDRNKLSKSIRQAVYSSGAAVQYMENPRRTC
eukprot:5194792-Pleurochrysis_carterae.AAC.7